MSAASLCLLGVGVGEEGRRACEWKFSCGWGVRDPSGQKGVCIWSRVGVYTIVRVRVCVCTFANSLFAGV